MGTLRWPHQYLANHDTFVRPREGGKVSINLASGHIKDVTYPSPFLEHLLAHFLANVGLENHAIFLVNLLELVELLPYIDSKASCNGCAQRGSFTHCRTIHRYADDVSLRLFIMLVESRLNRSITYLHAQVRVAHATIHCKHV
jgi:hypothetical protein